MPDQFVFLAFPLVFGCGFFFFFFFFLLIEVQLICSVVLVSGVRSDSDIYSNIYYDIVIYMLYSIIVCNKL